MFMQNYSVRPQLIHLSTRHNKPYLYILIVDCNQLHTSGDLINVYMRLLSTIYLSSCYVTEYLRDCCKVTVLLEYLDL